MSWELPQCLIRSLVASCDLSYFRFVPTEADMRISTCYINKLWTYRLIKKNFEHIRSHLYRILNRVGKGGAMLWCDLLHFVFYPSAWKAIVKFTGNLLNTTALEAGHEGFLKPCHWFIYKEGSLISLTYWQLHCIYWQSLLGIWQPWYNSCITCSYTSTTVHDIQGFSPVCIHWIIIMTVTLLLSDCCNCSYFQARAQVDGCGKRWSGNS